MFKAFVEFLNVYFVTLKVLYIPGDCFNSLWVFESDEIFCISVDGPFVYFV